MMLGQLPPLPGLQNYPVTHHGTSSIPLNVPYPRPVPTGFGLSKWMGLRPPFPSTPYGYQHKPLGGALGQTAELVVGGALGLVSGYLMTVGQLFIFSKIFDIDLSPKKLWLGAAVYYGLQVFAMLVTGAIAWGAVGPSVQDTQPQGPPLNGPY